jgi:hypothetical protein
LSLAKVTIVKNELKYIDVVHLAVWIMNCIKKGFIPQTLLVIDKEGYVVSNKEKVLQMWSEYYEKHFELQDGMDNGSGEEWTRCIQTPEQYVEPKNERAQEGHL